MRSLWQLIFRYHVFLVFLILQGLAISMLVRNNNFHHNAYISSSSRLTGYFYDKRSILAEYLRLQKVNEELARENALLRSEQPQAFLQLGDHIYLFEDTLYLRQYEFLPARVVNNSVNRVRNFITIDKGSRNGLSTGMGVACRGSVVGVVKDVSEHYATVMPLINNGFTISVKLARTQAFGRVEWDGKDPTLARVVEVPRYANPTKGDTLVTTGYSAYFPEGLMVGFVEDYRIPEGENFYEIDIRLSTQYYQLSYVEVIQNRLAEEQLELETLNTEADD